MKKINLKDCIYHDEVKFHKNIKNSILSEIEHDINAKTLNLTDSYYLDNINKLDWNECQNFERKWVKTFLPHFYVIIEEFLKNSFYNSINLKQMWYQQYTTNGSHGWHVHGCHYTGVYYLEFPDHSSRTELFFPFDQTFHSVEVAEGDMIIFPSHIIHRGMLNQSSRKTIISFNFFIDCEKVQSSKITDLYKK